MEDFKPMQKAVTLKDTFFVKAGTEVVINKDGNNTTVAIGKTGMILCSVPGGGSLFFEPDNLKVV